MIGVALLTPAIVYCADTYPVKPARIVAPFAPDGYTLLVMNTVHTINGAIIARLNEAAHKGLAQNDLRGKLAAEAAEAAPGTPEQFTALLQQEVQRYTALARKFKLQAI